MSIRLKDYKDDLKAGMKDIGLPDNRQFLAPANLPYSSLVNLLMSKKGKLLLHGIDGGFVVNNAMQQLLYKAYDNLPCQHHVIATKKNLFIEHLQISCLLSGGYNDLLQTIPNVHSQLYPQFSYYIVDKEEVFNPFVEAEKDKGFDVYYDSLVNVVYHLIFEGPYAFHMNETEQQTFLQHIHNACYTPQEALTCYRIAMILCILNEYERNGLRVAKLLYTPHL